MRKVTKQPIISPSGIQWTSIDKEGEQKQDDDAIEVSLSTNEINEKPSQLVLDYLTMLSRNRLNAFDTSAAKEGESLAGAIEGSLKLTQNVKFPKQAVSSLSDKTIPEWFVTAREVARAQDGSSITEFSSLQSIGALSQGEK